MISQETIDQVKAAAKIQDVVGDYVKLKKQGVNLLGNCPFHNEKTPSFTVSPSKGIYKCFGCGKSGDAVQFIIEHEQKTYIEAIQILAKRYNIEIEEQVAPKTFIKPIERLEKLSKQTIEWFEDVRKISNNTLLRLKITEAREWMPQIQGEATCICFNYYRGGELVNIKFRGPKKSFKLNKDSELIFYNLDALEGEQEAIIVEGEMDTATLVECGIYNVIGVPNGTAPKGSRMNLEYLTNCWDQIAKMKSVIIAVDNDEVGRFLKEELARRIGKEKCKTVSYPEGCKDPNEILIRLGKDAVKDFIAGAKPWPVEGLVTVDEQLEKVYTYYKEGYPPGLKSGFPGMDDLLTFYLGHLTMVTGVPGHGKDEVCNDLMMHLAKNTGMSWGIFNFEEPVEVHTTKLVEKYAQKAFGFRRDLAHRVSEKQFEEALVFINKHFYQVNMNEIDVTMQGIISKATELVQRFGINGIIINPWNYLEHKLQNGQSETHYVSEALTMLVNFLGRYGVHCFLVAHPSKVMKDKKTGKYEVPTLYSISGSAHFFNKTHNGICVYRHYDTNTTEIYVQKVKWYWMGQTGWAAYRFDTDIRQYFLESTSVVKPQSYGGYKPIRKPFNDREDEDDEE